jgi:hypothetical protein
MNALPTTRVTVLGGLTESEFGDPQDGTDEIATGIPAGIHESTVTTATESDPAAIVRRMYVGRFPVWARVHLNGARRIRDEKTGEVYVIDAVSRPQNASLPQDVRVDLRRVE